ncbi:helix-turn-helix domain-containing protein [Isoptericola sp. NEAU-Y5]|uniref:Helix-turn-helix domain-containing protein n=1 Tax=Isoptericola luteus TaxID=2879484 RepID=A0ABS7ZHP4_9MICO|nr:helix-turn-helix domain-containing protein [Isoptericola sp. NEAU-Y5]MCA5894548.1 helix-turn-helix domain-containing protein [Isoptericola sp. NEAU-Y5]
MAPDEDPTPSPAPAVRTLTEAKALAALANPFRARVLDALKVDGPSTTSALARRTGQAVGSASHHLKVLHEAGLVEDAPELAKDRRERVWRLVTAGLRWSRQEFADDPSALAAAEAAEALDLQRQMERTRAWLASSGSAPEWDATAFATQHWMRLSPAELSRFAEELQELLARWGRDTRPDDDVEREPVLFFARAFPAQP